MYPSITPSNGRFKHKGAKAWPEEGQKNTLRTRHTAEAGWELVEEDSMCSAGAAYEHKNTMMSLVCMWSGTGTQGLTFTAHQASTDEYKALTKCLIVFVQNNAILPVTFLNHMQTEINQK